MRMCLGKGGRHIYYSSQTSPYLLRTFPSGPNKNISNANALSS